MTKPLLVCGETKGDVIRIMDQLAKDFLMAIEKGKMSNEDVLCVRLIVWGSAPHKL